MEKIMYTEWGRIWKQIYFAEMTPFLPHSRMIIVHFSNLKIFCGFHVPVVNHSYVYLLCCANNSCSVTTNSNAILSTML